MKIEKLIVMLAHFNPCPSALVKIGLSGAQNKLIYFRVFLSTQQLATFDTCYKLSHWRINRTVNFRAQIFTQKFASSNGCCTPTLSWSAKCHSPPASFEKGNSVLMPANLSSTVYQLPSHVILRQLYTALFSFIEAVIIVFSIWFHCVTYQNSDFFLHIREP